MSMSIDLAGKRGDWSQTLTELDNGLDQRKKIQEVQIADDPTTVGLYKKQLIPSFGARIGWATGELIQ
jgi:hypothetical protein